MKKTIILFLLILIFLTGCKTVEEETVEFPVYEIYFSPAVRPVLPAIYACAAEFPNVIFSPKENYYQAGILSIQLGEPETLPKFSALIGYDEIVLATHPTNPITSWTNFRIINIMNGRIDNWDYLGWDGEVSLWLPTENNETFYLFDLHVLKDNPIVLTANLRENLIDISNAVADDPTSIGVIPASFANSAILVHSLDIHIPILALFDGELDEIQQSFLLCLQGDIGQTEIAKSYEPLQ